MEVSPHIGGGQAPGGIPAGSGVWCRGGTFPGARDMVELGGFTFHECESVEVTFCLAVLLGYVTTS